MAAVPAIDVQVTLNGVPCDTVAILPPNTTVVFRCTMPLSQEQHDRLVAQLRAALEPIGSRAILLAHVLEVAQVGVGL